VLKPSRDFAIDADDLARALRTLTGGRVVRPPQGDYGAIAGVTGAAPALTVGSNRPFDRRVEIGAAPVEIRMDSWLAADTIRRMGFGHVVVARRHTLIVERGISFAAFDGQGRVIRTAYEANLFEPPRRFVVLPRG
jgi:hypothetical protein